MSNIVIQRIQCVNWFGLLIDERLDWQEHINSCNNKPISALYAINRVNNFLPVSALKTIYYTLVYPYLTYGIMLLRSTYISHFTKSFIIQKKIIRSILKRNYMEQTHALFICLHLLKLNDIYGLEIGKFDV